MDTTWAARSGWAERTTDASGRLEIPAIAAGRLALVSDLRSRPDLPYRGLPPANQVVEAGQTTTMEIRLKHAVRLEGVIRERGTGLPIAGVSPEIPDLAVRLGGNAKVVTDAIGKFEGYIEGQQPYAFLYTTPKPYFIPSTRPTPFICCQPGATEFKLPPTELVRGEVAARLGRRRDGHDAFPVHSSGRPGAEKRHVLQSVAVRTDSSGSFLLDGLDPLADLRLTAESDGRISGGRPDGAGRAGEAGQARREPRHTRSCSRARASIHRASRSKGRRCGFDRRPRHTEGQVWRADPVAFGEQLGLGGQVGVPPFSVGERSASYRQGWAIPDSDAVPSGLEYEATVTARDAPPGRTAWLKTGGGPTAVFPMSCCIASGPWKASVHDRDGKARRQAPASSSRVTARSARRRSRTTGGRFRLPGVIAGKVILFARKDGFRFHGKPLTPRRAAADLVLTRVDETPPGTQDARKRRASSGRAGDGPPCCLRRTSRR